MLVPLLMILTLAVAGTVVAVCASLVRAACVRTDARPAAPRA